jgi:hypothetical protein
VAPVVRPAAATVAQPAAVTEARAPAGPVRAPVTALAMAL